jgi:hypothetical protein
MTTGNRPASGAPLMCVNGFAVRRGLAAAVHRWWRARLPPPDQRPPPPPPPPLPPPPPPPPRRPQLDDDLSPSEEEALSPLPHHVSPPPSPPPCRDPWVQLGCSLRPSCHAIPYHSIPCVAMASDRPRGEVAPLFTRQPGDVIVCVVFVCPPRSTRQPGEVVARVQTRG